MAPKAPFIDCRSFSATSFARSGFKIFGSNVTPFTCALQTCISCGKSGTVNISVSVFTPPRISESVIFFEHQYEKQQEPLNTILGILIPSAISAVHVSSISDTIQLAGGSHRFIAASTCGRSMPTAARKFISRFFPLGTKSAFSQPSGNPTSLHGNRSSSAPILNPHSLSRSSMNRKRLALTGVVMIVTMTPSQRASILATSIMGSIWPGAMTGNTIKCSCRRDWFAVIAMAAGRIY
nr:hypothetical protein TorRG33x02_025850 [Ipomoea trifida]